MLSLPTIACASVRMCLCECVCVYIYRYIFIHIVLPISTHVQHFFSLRARARFKYVMQRERERERERDIRTHTHIHTYTHTHIHTYTGVCAFTILCIPKHKCDTPSFAHTLYIDMISRPRGLTCKCPCIRLCLELFKLRIMLPPTFVSLTCAH